MRELLVTITLLSVVSSDESETKKRLEIPPEIDPNFWPVRGRRSYWDVGQPARFLGNLIDQENERADGVSGRETNYAGYTSSSETSRFRPEPREIVFDQERELREYFDAERLRPWPQKRPISLIPSYRMDDVGTDYFCGGRCGVGIGERRKADEDRSRRQQPHYVDEPGWKAIDHSRGNFRGSGINGDPFFITRGKKNEESGDDYGESRRRFGEVLNAYTTDPFFVGRGKKRIYDEEVGGDYEGSRFQPPNSSSVKRFEEFKFDCKMNSGYPVDWHRRTRRGTSLMNKGEEDAEEEKAKEKEAGNDNGEKLNDEGEKFSSDRYSRKAGRILTKRDKNSANNSHRYDESNDEELEYPKNIEKKNDDINDANKYGKSNFDENAVTDVKLPLVSSALHRLSTRGFFADYKPRNSQIQRDKHSNLQSILDEPFFISRGKKMGSSRGKGYLREVREENDSPIKKSPASPQTPPSLPEKEPVIISDIFNIYRGHKTNSRYYGDDDNKDNNNNGEEEDKNKIDNDDDYDYGNNDEKSKYRQRNFGSDSFHELSRNRRGMLDDLLSRDDPFYVARGKRLQPRRPIITFDRIDTDPEDQRLTTVSGAATAADELSIYAKTLTRRTKLLRKLTDFKKQRHFYL